METEWWISGSSERFYWLRSSGSAGMRGAYFSKSTLLLPAGHTLPVLVDFLLLHSDTREVKETAALLALDIHVIGTLDSLAHTHRRPLLDRRLHPVFPTYIPSSREEHVFVNVRFTEIVVKSQDLHLVIHRLHVDVLFMVRVEQLI